MIDCLAFMYADCLVHVMLVSLHSLCF
jgi:hypothetical protein